MDFGVSLSISTTPFFESLSKPLSWTKWKNVSGLPLKRQKALIYRKDSDGFYVYAKPNLCDTQTVVKYISRYLGRPVIALNRIDSYDGENVTFHYNRHEDNAFVKKTIPALDFISLLIQHIPEPHYKMTRYYGLYARHRSSENKLRKAIHPSKHKFILGYSQWRNNIAASFGYDPLCCSKCKATMTLTDLYFKHERVSLEKMYERSMAKIKCRSAWFIFLSASYCIYQQTGRYLQSWILKL